MESKVKEWLEKEGFPLEMRAAAAFRTTGFEVRQSTMFRDPETQESREMDVLARSRSEIGFTEISFILECKSSKHPWIVLCAEDALAGYNRVSAFCQLSYKARDYITNDYRNFSQKFLWLDKPNNCGYALRKAFSDADSGYAAAMSVAKASMHQLAERGAINSPVSFCFAFPIIVVDTPVLECHLLPTGELELKEVDTSEFLFHTGIADTFGTCIRVVHISAINRFSKECREVNQMLLTAMQSAECLEP